ncbi:MAG: hypothetical protein HC927_07070 [Deltaproteobacteria bacterium]|nr:hypothetical protein [Deltaproteobacteria bacterium]
MSRQVNDAETGGAMPSVEALPRWLVTRAGGGLIHTGGPPGEVFPAGAIIEAELEQVMPLLDKGWITDAPG